MVMRRFAPFLFGLACVAACARQTARSGASAPPAAASRNAIETPLKTADGLPLCPHDFKREGLYQVSGDVLPPVSLSPNPPDPALSDEALQFIKEQHMGKFQAISLVGMTVDAQGIPQNICLVKEAGCGLDGTALEVAARYGLDRQALEVAAKYRFKPATLHGKPVPVFVTVGVRFANFPLPPGAGWGGSVASQQPLVQVEQ